MEQATTGSAFLAAVLVSGRVFGIRPGASLQETDAALPVARRGRQRTAGGLRHDHDLLELHYAAGASGWTLTGVRLLLHRLPARPEAADEWRRAGVDFAEFTRWDEVSAQVRRRAGSAPPALERAEQGEFTLYRVPATGASAVVVAGATARDQWPGRGDVWSVALA
jgi:hypothetical protein